MEPRNPDYARAVEALFRKAAFVMDVGYELVSITPGRVDTLAKNAPGSPRRRGVNGGRT